MPQFNDGIMRFCGVMAGTGCARCASRQRPLPPAKPHSQYGDLLLSQLGVPRPGQTWGCLMAVLLFAPGPVEADVGVVLGHAGDGMSIGEQKLMIRIFEMVVSADVDHG